MNVHKLKIKAGPFAALSSGAKTGEVRNCSDRRFEVGDIVELRLIDETGNPTGQEMHRRISHIQTGYGLPEEICVLSYEPLANATCPGHGRSECVSCCWPKGDVSGVELGRQLVEQVLSVMPENYAGHSFGVTAPDGSTLGDVIITVVKPDGKGPHDLRVEAESRAKESDRLRDAMEVAINTLVYCYDKRPENFAAALTEAARLADESRSTKL